MDKTLRLMPERLRLGSAMSSPMIVPMGQRRAFEADEYKTGNPHGYRVVMGYFLPPWQRPLVWTQEQKVRLIESAWRGLSIGTYTYNRAGLGSPFDNLLLDGQQRLHAIECYLNDEFPVFGYRWSEVTEADRRQWEISTHFHSYITESEDEAYLRSYYNMMNFGGTPHTEDQRA